MKTFTVMASLRNENITKKCSKNTRETSGKFSTEDEVELKDIIFFNSLSDCYS